MPSVAEVTEFNPEQCLRRRAYWLGYILRKSGGTGRVSDGGTYQGERPRDRGLWMIFDAATNMPITGLRYELTLEDIEAFLEVRS